MTPSRQQCPDKACPTLNDVLGTDVWFESQQRILRSKNKRKGKRHSDHPQQYAVLKVIEKPKYDNSADKCTRDRHKNPINVLGLGKIKRFGKEDNECIDSGTRYRFSRALIKFDEKPER